jgi:dihydrofolate reductase
MRPLRYSINVTLDGCCDHREIAADEELHRHAMENVAQADALLFGRVTYEMMEAAWRLPERMGTWPEWMEPFARTIDAAKKYVVSSTLDRVVHGPGRARAVPTRRATATGRAATAAARTRAGRCCRSGSCRRSGRR